MEGSIVDIINNKLIFNNNNITTFVDDKNNVWFKAKDIANILGYKDCKKAVKLHVNDKYRTYVRNFIGGKMPPLHLNTIMINEPGLYQLIINSNQKLAEKFQEWVFEEVLPSIRKYGEYKLKNENKMLKDKIEDLELDNEIRGKIIKNKNKRIEQLKLDVVCKDFNNEKLHEFVLIKKNHLWEYPYYVVRAQKKEVKYRLKELHKDYPELEILLKFYDPNSINLYNQMKESLNILYNGNHFTTDYTESELLYRICKLNNDKLYPIS